MADGSSIEPLNGGKPPGAKPWRNRWNAYENRDELVAEICERLSLGEPLAHICRDSPHMPSLRLLWDWERQDEQIATAISRARQVGAHAIASDLLKVAHGEANYSSGDTNRDKLIVDTSLKLLAKWNPKQYGEATQVRHADADGNKLDTAPLVAEFLTMLGGAAPGDNALNVTPTQGKPAALEQPAPRAFDVGYRPRAKRPPPEPVDDLV